MIKKFKIPTIIGMIILFAGVFAGVFLLKNNQIFKIGASVNVTPKDVRISSISDTSATVSWVTSDPTAAFILYGTSQDPGTPIYESEDSQKYSTHSITITGLTPETNYFFKINSNGSNIDNNGVPWQFTTGKTLSVSQISIPISGSVITAGGVASKRAIVYITINGYTLSTITSDSGTFVLQLGSVRTPDLSAYAQVDPAKTLLDISATTETGESATAKIFPQSADPIPALVVGQDQDFRSLGPSTSGGNPSVNLNLPEGATSESKFNVNGSTSTLSKTVTLESVTEGETINSEKPQFFGDGPIGEKITITVHSETPVTGTTTVSKSGSWSWSPPSGLAPGTHTITISWIDTSGITRTLTRNFVVQASELPAFVATPSATPVQTPVPTKTPTPTKTPSPLPTATSKISPTPKPVGSATPAALPQSGNLTPTILLFIMGIGILAFSFYTWKISKE